MTTTAAESLAQLGFLAVFHEGGGYHGGYLVTNSWGRPLEFRISSSVKPNRVHHTLYGSTLEPYVCGEVIGKTLIDKTPVTPDLIVTDHPMVLSLRPHVAMPMVWVADADRVASLEDIPCWAQQVDDDLYVHIDFPGDVPSVRLLRSGKGPQIDLQEPFQRIGEAMAEARRFGVGKRD